MARGNQNTCSICELGESVCAEVARQFAVGLPASDVVSYLATQGHRRTQRQLVDHRRHVVSPKSARLATATGTASNPEILQTEKEIPVTLSSAEPDISDLQREERLILGFLAATDRMLASLEQTGSIKVSRAATELGALAHQMLRVRMERATPVDPVINIVISRQRLEDTEAVRAVHLDNLVSYADDQQTTDEAIEDQLVTDDGGHVAEDIASLWGTSTNQKTEPR